MRYMMEKQLAAVYATLLSTKVITGKVLVHIKTTYPIEGWLWSWVSSPKTREWQDPNLGYMGSISRTKELLV